MARYPLATYVFSAEIRFHPPRLVCRVRIASFRPFR